MPDQPMQMLRDIVVRGMLSWGDLVPDTIPRKGDPLYQAFRIARRNYRRAAELWQQAETAVDDVSDRVNMLDPGLTSEAWRDRVKGIIAEQGAAAKTAATELRDIVENTATELRQSLQPARPGPVDATQEAALANLRSDLAMVLDRVSREQITKRMQDLLREALSTGDALTAWFLGASPWPVRYLESRDADATMWNRQLTGLLVEEAPDQEAVHQLMTLINALESPKGMLGATAGLDHWIGNRLDPANLRRRVA